MRSQLSIFRANHAVAAAALLPLTMDAHAPDVIPVSRCVSASLTSRPSMPRVPPPCARVPHLWTFCSLQLASKNIDPVLCYPVPGHPARRARARRAGLDNITQDRDDLKNASEDFVRERDAHNSLRSELQLGQGRAQQEQQGRRKLEQQLPDIYYNDFPLGLQLLFAESVEEDVEVDFGRRGQARKSSAIICGRRRGCRS